ncbi:MAG: alpha-glucan family phosphorylase [Deltaproteobacteria bacterium]|nr:alpha-glucan family phosphorylase [Deltaproteobacteria bacterium]
MKPKLRTLRVAPDLPTPLFALESLALNLYWDWNPDLASLFARIDPELWESTGQNPTQLLGQISQARLLQLSADRAFLAHLARATSTLERYRTEPRWFQQLHKESREVRIAYFCAEFGLTGCMPIYSGGLGILAGDHLKSASDLGLPLVGVGLLYQEGYFRQYLNHAGWQGETYPPNDFHKMPIQPARTSDGSSVRVSVEFPGRLVWAQVWRAEVGRVPLYLLDTNVPENAEPDRQITRALYSGGAELRIQQLMILGIGGFRALVVMGLEPTVCHMNEGHAGFLGVERTRHLMQARGISYEIAREIVDDGNIFTTHTPVPAGFDVFMRDLVEKHMSEYVRKVGLSIDEFMALGRRHPTDRDEPLNMAVIAIRHAVLRNGVSELHGKVSRRLIADGGTWSDWPEEEVPIGSVTNGVHTLSWIAPEMGAMLDRYLGPAWRESPSDPEVWAGIEQIPAEELWRVHVELRNQLVAYVRRRLVWQLERRGASRIEIEGARLALDPDALTIGFARRFATYKRATLLFHDVERLIKIVSNAHRPVQFIFSGKAHPADNPAKELIRTVATKIRDDRFARSIVFLEDYEIPVARHLVRGVDLWLNTPQRPREASGTSGMKVVPNGGLNLSILDGWWAEGYRPGTGWAIGNGEDWEESRDEVEANALYSLLEGQIVPLFYDRDSRGCPSGWMCMVRASMRSLASRFSSDRMLRDYVESYYVPTARRYVERSSSVAKVEDVVRWKNRLESVWHDVQVIDISATDRPEARYAEPFGIEATVRLGILSPQDVDVQLYHGMLDAKEQLHRAKSVSMHHVSSNDGVHRYAIAVRFPECGRVGYTVRVVPRHEGVIVPNEMTRIRWAS